MPSIYEEPFAFSPFRALAKPVVEASDEPAMPEPIEPEIDSPSPLEAPAIDPTPAETPGPSSIPEPAQASAERAMSMRQSKVRRPAGQATEV